MASEIRPRTSFEIGENPMRRRPFFLLVLGLPAISLLLAADEPKPKVAEARDRAKLVGTWTLVSAKYNDADYKFPEGYKVTKLVTPTHFATMTYHEKDGTVGRAGWGTYELVGESYTETPEYSTSDNFEAMRGKAQTFSCKVEGNTWRHRGKLTTGMTVEEVYERPAVK